MAKIEKEQRADWENLVQVITNYLDKWGGHISINGPYNQATYIDMFSTFHDVDHICND